jgi:hypothetical protein
MLSRTGLKFNMQLNAESPLRYALLPRTTNLWTKVRRMANAEQSSELVFLLAVPPSIRLADHAQRPHLSVLHEVRGADRTQIIAMTQVEYIAILFTDCGYDTSAQRRGWIQKRFGKSFADELDSRERSLAIESLKEEKAE